MYKVLIVDDSELMREHARELVAELGYLVVGEACDGQEAVNKYFQLKPDLVLMDIAMPRMSGRDALNQIIYEDPKAKIIICSSEGKESRIKECMDDGAVAYIIKPFVRAKAIELIKEAIIQN